jgi:1,3,6,8-tetrahydroxynaphthalene synthase
LWRHLIQPIEKVQQHPGFDARGATDEAHTKARMSGSAVRQALD